MSAPPLFSHLTAPDGHRIPLRTWRPTRHPRGVFHICHGMSEHGGRYGELAAQLVESDWLVVAHDHRGHGDLSVDAAGQPPGDGIRGHYADQDGWQRVTDDVGQVQRELRASYPELPVVLMGHSMGTLIVQGYLVGGPAFWPDAVILSGASRDARLKLRALRRIVAFEVWRRGKRRGSPLIDKLTFGAFSKSVKNPTTEFDWLSRDPAEVQAYIDDPLCGFGCSTGLWQDLGEGLMRLSAPGSFNNWPDTLPLYIFSGGRDPVGSFGKGPRSLAKALAGAGQSEVTLKIYPEMRHEPLHEKECAQVISDLERWLDARLPTANVRKAG